MVRSYLLAVTASCSVAVGLGAVVPRLKRVSPGARLVLARLVPFAAVASASALNVFLMRSDEIREGIDVYPVVARVRPSEGDGEGEGQEESGQVAGTTSLGKSRRAATLAVGETALSRVLNATPIMVIPPLVLFRLQRTGWLKRRPSLTLPVNLGAVLSCLQFLD